MMSNGDLTTFSTPAIHHKHHSSNERNGLIFTHYNTISSPLQLQEAPTSLSKINELSSDVAMHHSNGCSQEQLKKDTDQLLTKCHSVDRLYSDSSAMHSGHNGSLKELPTTSSTHTTKPFLDITQKDNTECVISSKGSIVKKPRPNSLAILSRSHDLIHTVGEEEVGANIAAPIGNGSNHRAVLYAKSRAASADNLLQPTRPGLQQRRNQRPTSLLIPNILDLPARCSRTGYPCVASSNDLSFTSHTPTARQRSYSVPSTAVLGVKMEAISLPIHSLEEALSLLTKKKIGKTEIDERALLHRAADAGHVKLAKKCIQAGCTVVKQLNSLNGTSALHCAARADKNSAQITKLLLETGMVDVNMKNDLGETAIFSAIIHKNMDTVDVLVEHGCDINSVWQESTPLYLMLCNKDVTAAQNAISNGALITALPCKIRQPLHAVLDICHMAAITYQTMRLLNLMVRADGNVVDHLQTYSCNKPGSADQDIVYHIYRMEKGPVQNEGKQIVRSLVKLGYTPTRGELATMSQSDDDYDYLYSYIKSGPAPLKDLCVRAVRKACNVNVTYALNRCGSLIPEGERMQVLLMPPASPDHEYENVQVMRRHKDSRRSKRKSLKDIMNGIGRLSRRFSKKNGEDVQLSLPIRELEKKSSGPPPVAAKPNIKPAIKPKPSKSKYQKKESQKTANVTAVADIVHRYSDLKPDSTTADSSNKQLPKIIAVDNPAYIDNESSADERDTFVGSIAVTDEKAVETHDSNNHVEPEVTVKFHETDTRPKSLLIESSGKGTEPRAQTPMTDHAPDITSRLTYAVYKASIHIEGDDDENM